jgi:RNA polymerase sigma-B factor
MSASNSTIPALTPSRDERHSRTNRLLAQAHAASPTERRRLLDEVIVSNLQVARSVAARYHGRGIPIEDLEQVACMALVGAANRYDPDKADDFLTFAVPTIRGEVKRYFRDHGWVVRPTRAVQEAQSLINRHLAHADGHEHAPAELAEQLGLPLAAVQAALQARGCFAPSSLDQPRENGEPDGRRLEARGSDADYEAAEARVLLRGLTKQLKPRDRLILYLRFYEGRTQAEIGEELGVTQMQVSRLLTRVLARMRELAVEEALHSPEVA